MGIAAPSTIVTMPRRIVLDYIDSDELPRAVPTWAQSRGTFDHRDDVRAAGIVLDHIESDELPRAG